MRFQLVQDVAVAGVMVERNEVHVGVYGGPNNVCASLCFTFADGAVRAANVDRLRRWQRSGTPLSLLMHGETVRLFCERTLFRRAMETAGPD